MQSGALPDHVGTAALGCPHAVWNGIFVAPASCRLSRGRLALGCLRLGRWGRDAPATAGGTPALPGGLRPENEGRGYCYRAGTSSTSVTCDHSLNVIKCADMALHALLFSRDQEIIDLTGEVLKTLDIEMVQTTTAQDAAQRLTSTRFDAIIVDNADARGAVAVLSAAKSLPLCEQSIGIVLAVSPSSIWIGGWRTQSHGPLPPAVRGPVAHWS